LIEQGLSYKTLFFNTVTIISCAFSPVMNLCAAFVRISTSRGDPVTTAETHHSPSHYAHIHCLISICQWVQFFFSWRNSMAHLCTSMSDTFLLDCSSIAICCTARKCNGMLVGRFSIYCYTTDICL